MNKKKLWHKVDILKRKGPFHSRTFKMYTDIHIVPKAWDFLAYCGHEKSYNVGLSLCDESCRWKHMHVSCSSQRGI